MIPPYAYNGDFCEATPPPARLFFDYQLFYSSLDYQPLLPIHYACFLAVLPIFYFFPERTFVITPSIPRLSTTIYTSLNRNSIFPLIIRHFAYYHACFCPSHFLIVFVAKTLNKTSTRFPIYLSFIGLYNIHYLCEFTGENRMSVYLFLPFATVFHWPKIFVILTTTREYPEIQTQILINILLFVLKVLR